MMVLRPVLAEHVHLHHGSCIGRAAADRPEVKALGLVTAVGHPWWQPRRQQVSVFPARLAGMVWVDHMAGGHAFSSKQQGGVQMSRWHLSALIS